MVSFRTLVMSMLLSSKNGDLFWVVTHCHLAMVVGRDVDSIELTEASTTSLGLAERSIGTLIPSANVWLDEVSYRSFEIDCGLLRAGWALYRYVDTAYKRSLVVEADLFLLDEHLKLAVCRLKRIVFDPEGSTARWVRGTTPQAVPDCPC